MPEIEALPSIAFIDGDRSGAGSDDMEKMRFAVDGGNKPRNRKPALVDREQGFLTLMEEPRPYEPRLAS
jgi:hypothetical protein